MKSNTVCFTVLYDFIFADRCPTRSAAFRSSAHWNIDIQFFVVMDTISFETIFYTIFKLN